MSEKDNASEQRPAPPPLDGSSESTQEFEQEMINCTEQAEKTAAAAQETQAEKTTAAAQETAAATVTPRGSSQKESGKTLIKIGDDEYEVCDATANMLRTQLKNYINDPNHHASLNKGLFTSALDYQQNEEKQPPVENPRGDNKAGKDNNNSTLNSNKTSSGKDSEMEVDESESPKKNSVENPELEQSQEEDEDEEMVDSIEEESSSEGSDSEDELGDYNILPIEDTKEIMIDPDKILAECLAPLRDAKGTSYKCHEHLKKVAAGMKTAHKHIHHAEHILTLYDKPDHVASSCKLGVELNSLVEWLEDDEITKQHAAELKLVVQIFEEEATKVIYKQKVHEISLYHTKRNKNMMNDLHYLAASEAAGKMVKYRMENPSSQAPTMSNTEIAATTLYFMVREADDWLSMYEELNTVLEQHPRALSLADIVRNFDSYEKAKYDNANATDKAVMRRVGKAMQSYVKHVVIDYYQNLKEQVKQKEVDKAFAIEAQAADEKRIAEQVQEAMRLAKEAEEERVAAGEKATAEQIKKEKEYKRKLGQLQKKIKKLEAAKNKQGGRPKPPPSKPNRNKKGGTESKQKSTDSSQATKKRKKNKSEKNKSEKNPKEKQVRFQEDTKQGDKKSGKRKKNDQSGKNNKRRRINQQQKNANKKRKGKKGRA